MLLGILNSNGQETLSNLQVNPVLKNLTPEDNTITKNKSTKSTISLPFIDDFAKSIGFPDQELWINNYAFINQTYSSKAPSIGVATLDAIDGNGAIYANASSATFGADTLTSDTINLDYPGNETIILSFYYQPGGLGDVPEVNDSLFLEFFSQTDQQWINVWNTSFNKTDSTLIELYNYDATIYTDTLYGDTITDLSKVFHQVLIPVKGTQFLNTNFQFRFRNYASLSTGQEIEGTSSNSDHWNIDFVILDKDRSIADSTINDLAIIEPMQSMLIGYDAVPWHHFIRRYDELVSDLLVIEFANLYSTKLNWGAKFHIIGIEGLEENEILSGQSGEDLDPQSTLLYPINHIYNFPYSSYVDSASFMVKAILEPKTPNSNALSWNDTTSFHQKFYNYYAFDDGSAENGYGIIGEGTENAMVAMQFESFKEDTLRGIQIYFNQIIPSSNQKYYKIHVWDDADGQPGSIIYTLENQTPVNEDELNKFSLILFDEEIVLNGKFYIGWQKQNFADMLNVGFDVNRINKDKLFYNFSGTWKQSDFDGTVMLRPMFGKEINLTTSIEKPEVKEIDFKIYPNPANDILNVDIQDKNSNNFNYIIFDSFGRVHINNSSDGYGINISNLNSGIYFIKIINSNGITTTKKFSVIH